MEKIPNYFLKISLALVIVAIPLAPKWGNYALILLAITALVIYSQSKVWNHPPFVFYLIIAAYFIRIIWLVKTTDVHYGLKSLETEAPLAAIPLVFCFFTLSEEARSFFLKLYVMVAFSLMLFALINLLASVIQSPNSFLEFANGYLYSRKQMSEANMLNWRFAHPSFLSMFVLYGLTILMFLKPNRSNDNAWLALYACLGLIFTLLAGSRIGFVMMLLSLALYSIIEFRTFLARRVPLFILCSTLATVSFILIRKLLRYGFDALDPIRTSIVIKAGNAFVQKPLLGYGTGGERAIIRDEHLESIGYTIYHPHNQYLTELAQFGIVGSIPLFSFVVLSIVYSFKNQRWDIFCIMTIFAVFMTVESPVNSNKGLVPFMIAITLLGFNSHSTKKNSIV
jgi:O-antigen ligase